MAEANEDMADFFRLYVFLVFIVALWCSGKIFARIGMPALVGEIATGILLGPHVAKNFVPETDALILLGELGLVLLMMEAGLHVDLEMIKIVGLRALAVGLVGSLLPMGLGILVAVCILKLDFLEGFGVGAAMATMSTGIALNLLKAAGVLNQPTGQLIIAAATVNELVNISLITEIHAIVAGGPWQSYVVPLLVMLLLVAVMGAVAVKVMPCLLDRVILPRVARRHQQNVVLGFMFLATLMFMPLCKFTGSSELLGAFLAGFCFCSDEHVHHTWHHQVKRVSVFLMRFFFACSIGFTIPVEQFLNVHVWAIAALFLTCIVGKLCMGLLAKPFAKYQVLTLAFSWGGWGEFSFILALRARDGGLISMCTYSSLVLAVLISIVVCPTLLRFVLSYAEKKASREIAEAMRDTDATELGKVHNVYYCLQTRSHAQWGEQGALLEAIREMGCKIIDFRSFHPVHHVGEQHLVNELYLRDQSLSLVMAEFLEQEDQSKVDKRIKDIMDTVTEALDDEESEIKISRWLPGEGTTELIPEAHRQGSAGQMSPQQGQLGNPSSTNPSRALQRIASQEAHRLLQKSVRTHITMTFRALDEHGFPGTPRAHHELDGFVHSNEHDAFDPAALLSSSEQDHSGDEDDEDVDSDWDYSDNSSEAGV